MVGYRITLNISGDKFIPSLLKKYIPIEFYVDGITNKGDVLQISPNHKKYISSFNSIYVYTKNKLAIETDNILFQEELFINFLEKNYSNIINIGGDRILLNYDIYFSDTYFNMGFFNRKQLKVLAKRNIDIAISAIQMSEEDIKIQFKI